MASWTMTGDAFREWSTGSNLGPDLWVLVEAVVFPDAFRRRGQGFTVGEVLPVRGVGDLQDGVVILRWA